MFYETASNNHGLPHDPFKAIVAPRPIGWISSLSAKGELNLAPYSYFNGVSSKPPCVMFASEGHKDSIANISETREFVCSLATWELREQMNATSATVSREVDEFMLAGLTAAQSKLVKPPRVAESPCALECRLVKIVNLGDEDATLADRQIVIGKVVGIHIDEQFIRNGILDTAAMKPIARCGYRNYAVVLDQFEMIRPK
ncbi:MAG TPA: flavin reductase family protein [Xanthobacteraceae bacterium]|nr:flavin reductase family protein [Xanthobacteraceae bacterium]